VAAVLALVAASAAPGRAEDKDDARAIVERAIKATGGKDKLARLKASVTKFKGTLQQRGNPIELTAEIYFQAPTQLRVVYGFTVCGEKQTMTHVLNGNKGWNKTADDVEVMDPKELKNFQEEAWGDWLTSLVPLLEPDIKLTALKDRQVEGRPAVGVKASSKGHRDLSLFFDKESGLLVQTESRVPDEETEQDVTQVTTYKDYKEVEGVQEPMKFTVQRDGKPYFDGTVTEVKLAERLEDKLFEKP
jgi:hypothetical protein